MQQGVSQQVSQGISSEIDGLMVICHGVLWSRDQSAVSCCGRTIVLSPEEETVLHKVQEAKGGLRQSEMPEHVYQSLKNKRLIDRLAEWPEAHQPYGKSATG